MLILLTISVIFPFTSDDKISDLPNLKPSVHDKTNVIKIY